MLMNDIAKIIILSRIMASTIFGRENVIVTTYQLTSMLPIYLYINIKQTVKAGFHYIRVSVRA